MTIQLFEASTLYGLATAVAAIEQGLFGPHEGRRILVWTNNAAIPESVTGLGEAPGFDRLVQAFDEVVAYNEAIFPLHPSQWMPSPEEQPVWERTFRALWNLGDAPIHLVVESIQVAPGQALAWLFAQASIDVYADGLMSYGPTRDKILSEVGARIDRLLHLDLVPGLAPVYLCEFGRQTQIIDRERFLAVIERLAEGAPLPQTTDPSALLLGQYLSPLGLISVAEEEQLHVSLVEAAHAAGHRRVVFKPHPTAPSSLAGPMLERARELGVDVEVFSEPVLAEIVYARRPIAAVVGCFSTALMTAAFFDVPALSVGTGMVLQRLKPYPNSNRIPLVLCDTVLDHGDGGKALTSAEVAGLVSAVSFVMQPEILAPRRGDVTTWLTAHGERFSRFFPAERLGQFGLPGGVRTLKTRVAPTLRRVARRAYAVERRLEARFMGPIRNS